MSKITWKAKRILTEQGFLAGYLTIEDGVISRISAQPEGEFVGAGDLSIYPGLIDLHNHGFGGWSMTDACTKADVLGYVKALATIGVTGVLPTAKEDAFAAIAQVEKEGHYAGAKIYGIRSEGPFWARGGEHTVGLTWPAPTVAETRRLLKKAQGQMVQMDLAPELPGAYEVIRYLHQQGLKVGCCHTAAKAEQIFAAAREVGFEIAVHLGNGMQGIHHRNVGALGSLLLLDNMYYELICDLNHLCPEMLQLMFRIQPYSHFCLISDSNYIAGLPVGKYLRYGREMQADAKGLILNSDGRICGSGRWVLSNIGKLVQVVGVPEARAVEMGSLNPARYLGLEQKTGSLKEGKRADVIFVDAAFTCHRTYVGGQLVYDCDRETRQSLFNPAALQRKLD